MAALGALLLLGGCDQAPPDAESVRLEDGPLRVPPGYTAWFEVEQGEVFSDGFDILKSPRDLRIDSVSVVGAEDDSTTYLGARLGLPGRPDDFNQRMEGYPPKAVPAKFQIAAEGASLEAGQTYMLILGFKVEGDKPSVREGIRINYTVGQTEYTAMLDSRVVTCPPPLTENRCSAMFPAEFS